jgi:hypothetical protein
MFAENQLADLLPPVEVYRAAIEPIGSAGAPTLTSSPKYGVRSVPAEDWSKATDTPIELMEALCKGYIFRT